MAQELRERLRGDALAPVFLPDPVADLPLAGVIEALVTFSSPRILAHCAMNASASLGEGGHTVRDRVPLVLEEYGDDTFCHVPQQEVSARRARCTSVDVVLLDSSLWADVDPAARGRLTFHGGVSQPLFTQVSGGAFS